MDEEDYWLSRIGEMMTEMLRGRVGLLTLMDRGDDRDAPWTSRAADSRIQGSGVNRINRRGGEFLIWALEDNHC